MKRTRPIKAALICLLIIVIFGYTTTITLRPLISQANEAMPDRNTALNNSIAFSPEGKKDPIKVGDPIDDPIPHKK